jgi:hemoglobin
MRVANSDEDRAERRARIVQTVVDSTGVDDAMIRDLVHAFYGRVRDDSFIGPIFARVIGADWDLHLAKMCDFWSSVMLMSGRYKGNPMVAHMRLKDVRPEHFERWLELFRQTAAEICPPEAAAAFALRADNIARSLQLGMFFRPGGAPTVDSDGTSAA